MTPEILVSITLLAPQDGGRSIPIAQGEYRGVLGVEQEHFSARFFVSSENGFSPGETRDVQVQFLVPEAALPYFPVGQKFSVWEGSIKGYGKVLEILKEGC